MTRDIIPDAISQKTKQHAGAKTGGNKASTAGEASHKKPSFAEEPYLVRAKNAYQSFVDSIKTTK